MQKTFLSNLYLILILNLLIKPIWVLGIDVSVQNALGPVEYGNYFALINFAFLFVVALDFGLNNYTNRKISRDPKSFEKSFISLSFVKVFLSLVFFCMANLAIFLMGYSVSERKVFLAISIMFICQFFLLFLRANLSGIQEYRKDVVVSVVDKSLMILFVSVLLWTDLVPSGFSIYNFIYAQILAYFLAVFVVVVLLLKSKSPILKVNTVLLRGILNEIWPYALLGFLMLFYFKIDAVMIERMLPDGDLQAGFYAQAYKLLEACVMFAVLFSTLLFPMFSNLLKREKKVNDLVSSSLGLLLIPSVLLCIISCFYSSEIIEFLFDSNSIETVTTFPVLMFVLVPLAGSYIYGTLITAQGDLKLLNSISFIALLLNVIGNYYAINHYGIAGAAAVTLVTQFFVFGVQFLVSRKRFGLETDSKLILKASILVILTAISAYFSKDFQAHWLLKFIVLLVGFTLLAVAAKLIRLNSLKTISEGSLAE